MPKPLREVARITEAAAAEAKKSGRMLVQFITPGWGTSGYYSQEVLESAASDKVIPAGTQMYADHPTDAEDIERPVRSIKDLMAVTTEDARVAEDGALVGEVQVVPAWCDLVEIVRDSIGVSIRGSATDIVEGDAEGRRGGIIEGLVPPVLSVDFVTRAGRGGKVLSVLESARANQRAINHGISEATVNDTREALQTALRDAHATDKDTWLYVRDFEETDEGNTVWFELEGSGAGDSAGTYGQGYTKDDVGAVTLTDTRTEVRVVTKYVPATRSDSITTSTTESEEDTMPKIQIEESEHKRLVEQTGRVDALQQENTSLKAENTQLKEDVGRRTRSDRARELVAERSKEAEVAFTPLEVRGLLSDLPLTESGDLDEAKFTTAVDEDAAAKKAAGGAGTVTGFGGTVEPVIQEGELTIDFLDSSISEAFGHAPAVAGTQVKEA